MLRPMICDLSPNKGGTFKPQPYQNKWTASRILYYNNSVATFSILIISGDIKTNPGPENISASTVHRPVSDHSSVVEYFACNKCHQSVHYSFCLLCDTCNIWSHYSCACLSFDEFIQNIFHDKAWICPHSSSFKNRNGETCTGETTFDYFFSVDTRKESTTSVKGLIIGHLNIRSIQSGTKLQELKLLLDRKPTIHILTLSET